METVSKRDLSRHTASILDRVPEMGGVVVTEHGKPRWRLSAYREDQESPLARLEREGRYTSPASAPTPWPSHPGGPRYADADVEALLDEIHEER